MGKVVLKFVILPDFMSIIGLMTFEKLKTVVHFS